MKKNLFKWMMAIAIVATPMVFTSCGDDDDATTTVKYETGDPNSVNFYFGDTSHGAVLVKDKDAFIKTIASIQIQLEQALAAVLNKQYSVSETQYYGTKDDATKVVNAIDAVHARLKDVDLQGAYYKVTLKMGLESLKTYVFGKEVDINHVRFENATLNDQLFWIGDSINGTKGQNKYGSTIWSCTYTEGYATVNTSYANGYWQGFAISACKGTEFNDDYAGTDQYNNITGKAYLGNNFLVVYGQNADGNSITFSKPVTVKGFHYTNSAVVVNSIVNGDKISGGPFTADDWLKCIVTGTKEDGTTVTYDIMLAENGDYVKTWTGTRSINKDFTEIVKLEFSFDGTRKNGDDLNTPTYMCIDHISIE